MIVRIAKKGQFDVADLAISHRLLMVCVSSSAAALPKKSRVLWRVQKKDGHGGKACLLISTLQPVYYTKYTLVHIHKAQRPQTLLILSEDQCVAFFFSIMQSTDSSTGKKIGVKKYACEDICLSNFRLRVEPPPHLLVVNCLSNVCLLGH